MLLQYNTVKSINASRAGADQLSPLSKTSAFIITTTSTAVS